MNEAQRKFSYKLAEQILSEFTSGTESEAEKCENQDKFYWSSDKNVNCEKVVEHVLTQSRTPKNNRLLHLY